MIEFATSVLLLASAFTPKAAEATTTVNQSIPQNPLVATTTVMDVKSTEAFVRGYFSDTPILAEIARCESSFRQFDAEGNVLRGKVNRGDLGVMQINKYYHEEDAQKLGYDIYTLQGNLDYAKLLYKKYGDSPWVSSSKCWKSQRLEGGSLAKA